MLRNEALKRTRSQSALKESLAGPGPNIPQQCSKLPVQKRQRTALGDLTKQNNVACNIEDKTSKKAQLNDANIPEAAKPPRASMQNRKTTRNVRVAPARRATSKGLKKSQSATSDNSFSSQDSNNDRNKENSETSASSSSSNLSNSASGPPVLRRSARLSSGSASRSPAVVSSYSSPALPDIDQLSITGIIHPQVKDVVRKALVEGHTVPPDFDIDTITLGDPNVCGEYACDVFHYYRQRETRFVIDNYLLRQNRLTKHMRAILVDWLVEVQENFELNHETLYQAVKLTDLFLCLSSAKVKKEQLQLVGASSMFIACKFDERIPPLIEDFLFICDDAYTRDEFIAMEIHILNTVQFDIGFPLSYRFLRRFARCCKDNMEVLTFARYVLEYSLMVYEFVTESESRMAAACLLLAHLSKRFPDDKIWPDALVYHTGYDRQSLVPLCLRLNQILSCTDSNPSLQTVKTKYSHEVFHKVAGIPLLNEQEIR